MLKLRPGRSILNAASYIIGIMLAQTVIDQAGLSYSKAAPFANRALAMALIMIGSIFLSGVSIAFLEMAADRTGLTRSRAGKSITLALVVGLCLGSFWLMHTLHIALPTPANSSCDERLPDNSRRMNLTHQE